MSIQTEGDSSRKELLLPQSAQLIHLYADESVHRMRFGSEAENRTIIEENIFSLRRLVEKGKHDVLFDPAVGYDTVRLLLAYDPRFLIAVDANVDTLQKTRKDIVALLEKVRIACQEEQKSESVTVITFILDEKPRTVVLVNKDARDISVPHVDVWHSYLPTGTEQESEKQRDARLEGEYGWILGDESPTAHEGFTGFLSWRVYSHVSEGGFIARDERGLLGDRLLPETVADICGVREYKTPARHPFTVLTSLYPSTLEKEYEGVLVQKVKTLNEKQFLQVMEIVEALRTSFYLVDSLEAMQLYYFKDEEGMIQHPEDIVHGLQAELQLDLEKLLPALENDEQKIEQAVAESLQAFQDRVREFQSSLQQFFKDLEQYPAPSDEEQLRVFGITEEWGTKRSRKYPFALELFNNPEYRAVFEEFSQAELFSK